MVLELFGKADRVFSFVKAEVKDSDTVDVFDTIIELEAQGDLVVVLVDLDVKVTLGLPDDVLDTLMDLLVEAEAVGVFDAVEDRVFELDEDTVEDIVAELDEEIEYSRESVW